MTLLDLYNAALALMGEPPLPDADANTQAGSVLRLFYPAARQRILSRYHWNFARKRTKLAPLEQKPEFGYTHMYPKPDDLVSIVSVNGEAWEYQAKYIQIEGKNILSNHPVMELVYIQDKDISEWEEPLAEILALALASMSCIKITASLEIKLSLDRDLEALISDRMLADARNNSELRTNYSDRLFSRPDPMRYPGGLYGW